MIDGEPFHHSFPLIEVSEEQFQERWRTLPVLWRFENMFPFPALYDPDQHRWITTEPL